jgi:hypothetical protein
MIFTGHDWPMTLGERAALEGLLSVLRPRLSIAVGTTPGGSLRRIAAHSREVHSVDRSPQHPDLLELGQVEFHHGDGDDQLRKLLDRLAEEGRNVGFVLIDGDHATDRVRQDVVDLLESPATADTVIMVHDTMCERVRLGIEWAGVLGFPKVSACDLDAVSGYLLREGELRGQLQGGFGIITTDARRVAYGSSPERPTDAFCVFPLLAALKEELLTMEPNLTADRVLELSRSRADLQTELRAVRDQLHAAQDERDQLARRLGEAERIRTTLTTSKSWKLTRPLRAGAAAIRAGR